MNSQIVRAALTTQLPRDESNVLHVYDDAIPGGKAVNKGDKIIGNLTIGIGRNVMGKGISDTEAQYLMANDISDVFAQLDNHFPWWSELDDSLAYVLSQLCFNMGMTTLLTFTNTLAAFQKQDRAGIVSGLEQSKWYTQVGDRAKRIIEVVKTGALPS